MTPVLDKVAGLRAHWRISPRIIGRRICVLTLPPPPGVDVDRSAHGTGLAQRLMSAAWAAAREFGGVHLWLGVWERNRRAIAYYGKEGFVDVGSKFDDVGADRKIDRILVAKI